MLQALKVYSILLLCSSCSIQSASDKIYTDRRIYKLQLQPTPGLQYSYEISNESEMSVEVASKTVENINRSSLALYCKIGRDSSGNFLLTSKYSDIHIYSKNGDTENDYDASGEDNLELFSRMLAALENATIITTLTPAGVVKDVKGYDEMGEKFIQSFTATDELQKVEMKKQWDQVIGKSFIRGNMDQLFKMFPDSAVHVGDKWKLDTDAVNELNLKIKTIYELKDIDEDITTLESEGILANEKVQGNLMGYDVTANLSGKITGEYEHETKTGMLLKSRVSSKMEGTIEVMGREVPVTIRTLLSITGKKIK